MTEIHSGTTRIAYNKGFIAPTKIVYNKGFIAPTRIVYNEGLDQNEYRE